MLTQVKEIIILLSVFIIHDMFSDERIDVEFILIIIMTCCVFDETEN